MNIKNISHKDLDFLEEYIPFEFLNRGDITYREFNEKYSIVGGTPHFALYFLVSKFGNNFYSDFNDGETVFKYYLMLNEIVIICTGGDSFTIKIYVKKESTFSEVEKECREIIKYFNNAKSTARDACFGINGFELN